MTSAVKQKLNEDVKFLACLLSHKFQKGHKEHAGKADDLANLSLSQKAYQILEEQIDAIWYTLDLYQQAKEKEEFEALVDN
jgi:hypothetical protein